MIWNQVFDGCSDLVGTDVKILWMSKVVLTSVRKDEEIRTQNCFGMRKTRDYLKKMNCCNFHISTFFWNLLVLDLNIKFLNLRKELDGS